MQLGNAAKVEMLRAAYEWRQEFDAAKHGAEVAARQSDLNWAKERFFLEREEARSRLAIEARNERKAFCEKLVLEGKSPEELEKYLRLVYPEGS
ncbi:uncharacterized protein MELLADRAFT_70464 [Melampsora larici-populina 98AG31]|uniref:Uncharacterized protein n=1 Tax=Melampsora larici-populina (strain 98AG31 / pathotype 3-4-7) TaxID=747676 RepID=F4R425_MELLP|nr:uncharacterized protein MELLADRAFT_70464 [Melampsora larici-populina 98AG31]EGG13066.1 hypothetical protein MELLADRAFT_70464 [Melampsora larici-populina 98AG31]